MKNHKFSILLILTLVFASCQSDTKEIYENVFLKQIKTRNSHFYTLEIHSKNSESGWSTLVVDSLYSKNGTTLFIYGLPLRGESKSWSYVTGPNYNEGGALPEQPYGKKLQSMSGESLTYYPLISADKIWNEN